MTKRVIEILLLLVMLLSFDGSVQAQEDVKITLKGTKLVGLPYEKAELDFENSRLRIENKELLFTPYLQDFFKTPGDVKITASWRKREAEATKSAFIDFTISPKADELGRMLRFNMGTLELISIMYSLDGESWMARGMSTERLRREMADEIRKSIRTINDERK